MKKLILVLMLSAALNAGAATVKWEYLAQNYETQETFMKIAKDLGDQGWELTTCPTTGSSPYSASIVGGGISATMNGRIARSAYCIFKRPLN